VLSMNFVASRELVDKADRIGGSELSGERLDRSLRDFRERLDFHGHDPIFAIHSRVLRARPGS
jgi:hypothetical protein